MLTLKTPLKKAEHVKKYLLETGNFNKEYCIAKDKNNIYFPIIKKFQAPKKYPFIKFSNKTLKKLKKEPRDLKTALLSKLSKKELKHLKTAFDTVGSIAILEVDDILKKKEKLIAKTLLETNKNIKTVLRKSGIHTGVFRTQKLKYLAGKKTKESIHVENSIKVKLDVEKVYFSPRLATERKRISGLTKKKESVLVMFSGCGVYAFVIAKNAFPKEICAIEINPVAQKYALENLSINGFNNVKFFNGDVRKVVPKLKKKFDRVLMPLPKGAEDFLDIALSTVKKNGVIHFYDFLNEREIPHVAIAKIDMACKKAKKKYKILGYNKCGHHAPYVFRICIDFRVS